MSLQEQAAPRASLSVLDGVAIMVGIVVGIGIFKTPPLVAANVASEAGFIGLWLLGGLITLIGALVYAELTAAYPSTGGEYHFLSRALGRDVAFLFAWARISVIQTGAIAAVAFVFGDYAQQVVPLGTHGPAIYAGLGVIVLTALNVIGTPESKYTQLFFTILTVVALLIVVLVGLIATGADAPTPPAPPGAGSLGAAGFAMIFVLLTYGGWNEAAYISAEVRDVRRNMVRILVIGTAVVTLLYVLINFAYVHVLGLDALRKSDAVGADLMRQEFGDYGAIVLSLVVGCAALTTLNGTIFTGARIYHALGSDIPVLGKAGLWSEEGNNPRNALLIQGVIAFVLVLFGAATKGGFQAMVEYTAPVFWGFLLLVGVSFFVLRQREPERERPFRTPFYPVTAGLFCLTCAYLVYASLAYTRLGALVGVAVLLLGVPLMFWARGHRTQVAK
jgi:basic amino acid/polyamine antiporter, APA family